MSLKGRIAASMLSVVGIAGGVCTLVGGHLLWQSLHRDAENRVHQDLNAAQEFYTHRLDAVAAALRYTALGERFSEAVARKELDYLSPRLAAVSAGAALDMLYVTDAAGRVLHRVHRPGASGDSAAADRLVGRILQGGRAIAGTILVPIAELEREHPALAERARIPILPTPKAKPSEQAESTAGMTLAAAVAVFAPDGKLVGVLRAGVLLNRSYELVDQIQNTVFRGERYAGRPLGTATIFQNDLRISTNVLRADGTRAIGTRVSAEVHDCVLRRQQGWLGSAWVVNDWYVSAYAPIHDLDGKPIGMLYVGVLQAKFRHAAGRTMLTFGAVTFAGLLAAALAAWRLAGSITRPVRELARASKAVAAGDFSGTVPVAAADEIGALARGFNAMARCLHERDELLKERTRMQLTRSERLASVGRLAAGVAHEINNPLTGVLTFSHVLLKDAPPGSQQQADLQTIIDATTRCRDIIRGLLNFSRQSQPRKRPANLNGVLAAALKLTRNQARMHQIRIVENLDPSLPDLVIDPDQIQEVAVNAVLNAVDAMPGGGTLTVGSRGSADEKGRWVEFSIADTGEGIPEENLERIFDPFFTTKPAGQGTGLGLAISYGIVTEHGGTIGVSSRPGDGTTISVRLPVTTEERADEAQGPDPGGR